MKKRILPVLLLFTIVLQSQNSTSIDTTAYKVKVTKAYQEINSRSQIEAYNAFLEPAEVLYSRLGNKQTLALWLSKSYYDMAKKFNVAEKTTTLQKQRNYAYVAPQIRKEYLLKAKDYLKAHLGYYSFENFKHIEYELKAVESEIETQ